MPRGGHGRNSYSRKSHVIVNHIVDERGRVIEPKEFYEIMMNPEFFQDRYDHRRLALALMFTTGIRGYDAIHARFAWFTDNFQTMQMSQCKPAKKTTDDGVIHLKTQPRNVPLPDWLAEDLRCFVKYRLVTGQYAKVDPEGMRIWPKLSKAMLHMMFKTWRDSLGNKYKWLNDVWRIERGYNEKKELIWERKIFRVSCHAGRANYCTSAYLACDKDIKAAQVLSGHTKVDNLSKYLRVFGLNDKKEDIKTRFMNPLCDVQPTPLLVGQKTLFNFQDKKVR